MTLSLWDKSIQNSKKQYISIATFGSAREDPKVCMIVKICGVEGSPTLASLFVGGARDLWASSRSTYLRVESVPCIPEARNIAESDSALKM